jgi:hypothetical protein
MADLGQKLKPSGKRTSADFTTNCWIQAAATGKQKYVSAAGALIADPP